VGVCAVGADKTLVFAGNLTSQDHFHELLLDGDFLIVGARCVDFPLIILYPIKSNETGLIVKNDEN